LTGENLKERSNAKLNAWYSGDTLLQMIDSFRVPPRLVEREFRFVISDIVVQSNRPGAQVVVAGQIQSGCLVPTESVMIVSDSFASLFLDH